MKAIMVMFDSLNRNMLSSYGCDWTKTPNFKRLLDKTVVFDNSYVGSLPCMPARRELHTGRFNFLHRSWGPIEPFDDSMPEILKNNGIVSHLISDHQHYWEDGGATYHTRYSSWEITRGQEGDPWKCEVDFKNTKETAFKEINIPLMNRMKRQDSINRKYMNSEDKMPQAITFNKGIEFINNNKDSDNWFLQIETFDPHEPFYTMEYFKSLYKERNEGKETDWPPYYFVQEGDTVVNDTRLEYAALLSMCDHYLGKVLDKMDEYNLWDDTMLIVNTDHGYLLGEHGWWSKSVMPLYNEIANTPLFIWDPRERIKGERRSALVQTVDIAPTILDYFGLEIPKDMEGKPLRESIANDKKIRDYAVFGYHGAHINCTDGEHLYMRAPKYRGTDSLNEYTLMPTHMRARFSPDELQDLQLSEAFSFTKGCKTLKIKASKGQSEAYNFGDKLFDIKNDPKQLEEIDNLEIEVKMLKYIKEFMDLNDAPIEAYERFKINTDGNINVTELKEEKEALKLSDRIGILDDLNWEPSAINGVQTLLSIMQKEYIESTKLGFENFCKDNNKEEIKEEDVINFINTTLSGEKKEMALYFVKLACRTK